MYRLSIDLERLFLFQPNMGAHSDQGNTTTAIHTGASTTDLTSHIHKSQSHTATHLLLKSHYRVSFLLGRAKWPSGKQNTLYWVKMPLEWTVVHEAARGHMIPLSTLPYQGYL